MNFYLGEACWWTVHPASKQRSEGEKVRVSDDIILSSVSSERYLHLSNRFHTKIIEEEVEQVEGSSRFLQFLILIYFQRIVSSPNRFGKIFSTRWRGSWRGDWRYSERGRYRRLPGTCIVSKKSLDDWSYSKEHFKISKEYIFIFNFINKK